MLGFVLSCLSIRDVRAARGVCRSWRLGRAIINKLTLHLINDPKLAAAVRLCVPKCAQSLDLTNGKVTSDGLGHVAQLINLQRLTLNNCFGVEDPGLVHVATLPLQRLSLQSCYEITDSGLAHLATLSTLEQLNLNACFKVSDAGLLHLIGLSDLKDLDVCRCRGVTNAGLQRIRYIHQLAAT